MSLLLPCQIIASFVPSLRAALLLLIFRWVQLYSVDQTAIRIGLGQLRHCQLILPRVWVTEISIRQNFALVLKTTADQSVV